MSNIDDKLEEIKTHLSNIDITLVRNTVSLETHVKRTEMAEDRITQVEKDIKPLQKHMSEINGVLRFLGLIGIIIGAAAGLATILHYLKVF